MFPHKLSSRGSRWLFTDSDVISREMSRYCCFSEVKAGQLIFTGFGSLGFLKIYNLKLTRSYINYVSKHITSYER